MGEAEEKNMNEKFERWETLLLQYLKRDWKKIIIWVIGLGLFSSAYVPAFEEIAKGQGLIGMFETMRNPAMISMVGSTPIKIGTDYTIGAMYAQQMLLFCGVFAMIVSALHVISHTRKEEDLGLTELVRSFRVGRQANSLAVLVETILINLILALMIAGLMSSFDATSISVEGSLLFGSAIGFSGILGALMALVLAQIMPTSAGATGGTLSFIGLLYVIRAATDVSAPTLSNWNPLGWVYLTYPFTENRWFFLLYGLLFGIVLLVKAFFLEEKRDMGSGYLPTMVGRSHARRTLLSVPGLLLRLNRGLIISWLLAFLIMGALYGSIYGDMQTFLESNDLIKQMFEVSGASIEASFTSTIMMVLISLVAILPIAMINKLYAEESRGHFSQFYATKMTRGKLYWTAISLAVLSATCGILLSSIGLGGTALTVMDTDTSMTIQDFLAAGFNFFPSVLFFISLAALALGWVPKLGKMIYAYLGYSFALNYFSGILDLPEVVEKTAIQSWFPKMPVDSFDAPLFIIVTLLSSSLILLGFIGYKTRDLEN